MLDEAALIRVLIATHWVGMVLALGTAVIADTLGLGILLTRMRGSRRMFRRLHQAVGIALFLLLFSGGGLIALRSSGWCELDSAMLVRFGDICVPNKVVAKLILISVLVGVALLIDSYVLPLSKRADRPLLPHLSRWQLIRAALIGSASLTCWISLSAIPLIKELHRWPVIDLLKIAAFSWLALGGCLAVGLVAVKYLGFKATPAETQQPKLDAREARLRSVSGARTHSAPTVTSSKPISMGAALSACRGAFLGNAGISFVINLLMLAGPLYMLQVYDRVLTSRSLETLTVLTTLLVGLYFFLGTLDIIRTRILGRIAIRLDNKLGPYLFEGAIGSIGGPKTATSQPMRDLEQIRQFISGPALPALFDLPWAPLYIGLVFLLHPLLGLVALSGTVLLVGLSILNQVLSRKPLALAAEELGKTHALVEAGRRDSETLRAMGMVGAQRARWLELHHVALSRQLRASDIAGGFAVAIKIGRLLLQSLILGTGAYLSLNDAMSPGAMIASSIIAARALAPVEQLIAQWRSLVSTAGSIRNLRTQLPSISQTEEKLALPEPRGHLEVSKLYVAAPGRNEPILKGLNFRLEPGDALAVIGPSASGKSTLARALVGVWPIRHGEVRLDGAELDQWDPNHLGQHIGYLPQEIALFDGTIVDNIARLDPDADPRAVLAAANAAGVHKMILRLEQGYGTRVGEGGVALSGGQRQRIALARALYRNPALIIMDEPNANLDAEGEAALVTAIKNARSAGSTVIVMAHRQSVLAAVNRVLILKDGRQVAFGSPHEIVSKARTRKNREPRHGNTAAIRLATANR